MAEVQLESVGLSFGPYDAIHNVSFDVPRGQFVALVGPTGCGKSSLLNLVAGLLKPSRGTIRVAGRQLDSINRDAAYMFQSDALLPWKTALENIMLGPILRGIPRVQAAEDANLWIERVGLRGFEYRYPSQLADVLLWAGQFGTDAQDFRRHGSGERSRSNDIDVHRQVAPLPCQCLDQPDHSRFRRGVG